MSTAKKPAAAKPAKIKEGVDEILLQWFKDNNRPATTQGIVDALGSRIAKPACQKSLDGLVEQGCLLVKEVKKAKYYYLDQKKLGLGADETTKSEASAEPSVGIDVIEPTEEMVQLESLRATFVQLSKDAQAATAKLSQLRARRTRDDALAMTSKLREDLAVAQQRLTTLSSTTDVSIDWPLLQQQNTAFRGLWRRRKQICDQIVDAVSGDGPRDTVVDESGITLDAVGASYEDSAVNTKKRAR